MVTNSNKVYSVQFFLFQGKVFLGASGDSNNLDVFDMKTLTKEAPLSNRLVFL